ncbi:MAG: hypothetical protein CL483_03405 [Acidobacteria bacterium]|nr:hypothetical protein [Acidobacteriota bacterium]
MVWPFVVAAALSLLCTPLVRAFARDRGIVAAPKVDRWHQQPTPLLGGVGVWLASVAATLVFSESSLVVMGTASCMFLVGVVDDGMRLRPATKLTAQIIAASILVAFGVNATWTGSLTFDAMLTILWIVGLTNAFNLLDNMDGLCAGIALIALGAYLAAGFGAEPSPSLVVASAMMGALAGFLVYNFKPASIFLGDSGSLFVGFTVGALTVGGYVPDVDSNIVSVIAVPVLILLIPIFDTTLVTVSRKLSGRSASQGGTDHSSHRLVALGFSERGAVLVLYALAAMSGFTAFLVGRYGFDNVNLLIGLVLVVMVLFGVQLARVGVYKDGNLELLRNRSYTPLLIELTYKRRVFEILLDFVLVSMGFYAAYRLRFGLGDPFSEQFPGFINMLPVVIGCTMGSLWMFGAYRGVWRYFGLTDLTVFVRAIVVGLVLAAGVTVMVDGFSVETTTTFIITGLVLLFFLVGARLSVRAVGELGRRREEKLGRPVVIYGAGDAGVMLAKELLNNRDHQCQPVSFLDDDPAMHGRTLLGFTVLGGIERLEEALNSGAAGVVISTDVETARLATLVRICNKQGVPLHRMQVRLEPMKVAPRVTLGSVLDQAEGSTPPTVSPPTTKPRLH